MCQFHCFLYQHWILSELHVWNFSQFVFTHSFILVFMVRCQQAKNHIGKKENFINESWFLMREIRWTTAEAFSLSKEMVAELAAMTTMLCFWSVDQQIFGILFPYLVFKPSDLKVQVKSHHLWWTEASSFAVGGNSFSLMFKRQTDWLIFALLSLAWIQRKLFLDKSKLAGPICFQKYLLLPQKRCLLWMLWFLQIVVFLTFIE